MNITLELPDTVVALLGEAPERTIYRLIKTHLAPAPAAAPRGRPVSNAERDAAIADKALAGATHAAIANEYGLSTVRVSQIAVQGKAAALIRNPKPKPIQNRKPASASEILRDWSQPEPIRNNTPTPAPAPIHNNTLHGVPLPSHDFDLTLDF
jgi:transposase-like protein